MAVNKIDAQERRRQGTALTTADTGITWTTIDRPKSVEYRDGIVHKTVITVPAFSWTTTAAAKGIGQRVYQFPEGHILPLAAAVTINTTVADGATAGEVGLGTTVASGAVAVLSGTAAFQDILDGKTLSNHTAATALASTFTNAAGGTSGTMAAIDGSSTAAKVHLNLASTFAGTGGGVLNSATVTLWWIDLGDR